jgi:cytochrome c peroxidase
MTARYRNITWRCNVTIVMLALVLSGTASLRLSRVLSAQQPDPPPPVPPSLKTIGVPLPQDLDAFVKNRAWAVVLGKALFWDMDAGSDRQACASCHFHAGADNRVKNQFNPGFPITADKSFGDASGLTGSGAHAGPNYTAIAADFPFHRLSDPENRESLALYDTNDRFSSQGTFNGAFVSTSALPILLTDMCDPPDPATNPFHVGNVFVRKVEPRNTPTMINAGFNFRNFWDGRANNIFNGVSPFGRRDTQARIWVRTYYGSVTQVQVALENSSLASQAVGPPLSDFEMSCAGRTFADLGRKMLPRRALGSQLVHPQDSVLGPYASGLGLRLTYAELVQNAFHDKYWAAIQPVNGSFTQMEANFSLFWGLSIMLYEATLVSDEAPFDRFRGDAMTPPNPYALTTQQQLGLDVFMTKGKCINCHGGPEFSNAASHLQAENQENGLVERMLMRDNGIALYDNGFYNIGVRPSVEDPGVGGRDPFGNPLSFTEQYIDILRGRNVPDPFQIDACTFEQPFTVDFQVSALTAPDCHGVPKDLADINNLRTAVQGFFKVPSLRNVALTGPYFHNGGQATLGQVVAFYNRGGDRVDLPGGDSSGVPSLADPDITELNLTRAEQLAVVAFLESLTDPRVSCEGAPFDHPELLVPNGHQRDQFIVVADPIHPTRAADWFEHIPAVGSSGRPGILQPCLGSFASRLGLSQSSGVTGR